MIFTHHDDVRPYPTDWDAAKAIPLLVDKHHGRAVDEMAHVQAAYTVLGYGMIMLPRDHAPIVVDHPNVPESEVIASLDEFAQAVHGRAGDAGKRQIAAQEHAAAEEEARRKAQAKTKKGRKGAKRLDVEPGPPRDNPLSPEPGELLPVVPKLGWETMLPYVLTIIYEWLRRR